MGMCLLNTHSEKELLNQALACPHEADVCVFGTWPGLLQMGYSHGSLSQI